MKRSPLLRALPVALTLSLFLGWLAVSVVHQHADQPGCELCKAMHSGIADLAKPAPSPAPRITNERIILPVAGSPGERDLPLPRGRAPPVA